MDDGEKLKYNKDLLTSISQEEIEGLRGADGYKEFISCLANNMLNYDGDLPSMTQEELIAEILKLRNAIRYARDQQGDEKCWLDFFRLFDLLPEKRGPNPVMLNNDQMLKNCKDFIHCMQCRIWNGNLTIDQIYEAWDKEKPY